MLFIAKYNMLINEIIKINLDKREQQRKLRVPSTPVADQVRHERVIRKLTTLMTRNSNLPHATQADINTAIKRCKTNQKRVNFEYEQQQKLALQKQRSHKRRS